MPDTIFKGVTVTDQDILGAINGFDAQYPHDSNEYDSWLEKKSYKYAIQRNKKLYPPKHILSRATGIDTSEFNGGEQTNRVFRELGFHIINKP